MSALWTSETAAKATHGKAIGKWQANGLSIDTRSLQPGDLFVPLKDIRDGHDFIPMAYERGAAAVISEHEITDTPALLVDNAQKALEDLARSKSHLAKRVAVTGSVGKTSVKEMIACICRAAGKTHASIKSYNNHWGVPLTLAGMPEDTEFGIFEMGMNHKGELEGLSAIVKPDVAVITKIAPAHLAHFASIDEIAGAKAEIFTGIATGGVAIVPHGSPYLDVFRSAVANAGAKIATFGREKSANSYVISSKQTANGSHSTIRVNGTDIDVELPIAGQHWVDNAACALLVADTLGVDLKIAATALKNMTKIPGRGEVHRLKIAGHNIILVDESYNANPESMRAAIDTLGLRNGRKIAVLGDMLELGDTESELHAGLLSHDVLSEKMDAGWYENHETCLTGVINLIKNNDSIMIKGSNASGMSKLVAALIDNNNKGTN
jgi:UDP-N-acetylmuramoyl-tripeptide--D-alanyl-D-alanine ligase